MPDDRSGDLLARWRAGNEQAAGLLFERYAARLIALARSRLSARLQGRVDPEDVVMSAYRSFFAGAKAGRFDLERGGDLWRLLVAMTLRKLYHQVQRHSRGKRAVGQEQASLGPDGFLAAEAAALAREPAPVEAVALAEQVERMMAGLEPLQRRMLELRLQGYTLFEIAEATQRTERTVRRLLERVKQQWESDAAASRGRKPSGDSEPRA
jgi:RNA polymerase sigma factor (sigma-70 family)